jgi:hypothetical protein
MLKKTVSLYKAIADEIDSKFGGMASVEEQIQTAKLKEMSVS